MKKIVLSLTFVAALAFTALADIAPRPPATPKPEPSVHNTRMEIRLVPGLKRAQLIVPASLLKDLGGETTASSAGMTSTPTIIGGALFSLAFVFGGVWLFRSPQSALKKGGIAAAGLLIAMAGGFAAVAYANAGPPSGLRVINSDLFNNEKLLRWKYAVGQIDVIVEETNYGLLTLQVPLVEDKKKGEEE